MKGRSLTLVLLLVASLLTPAVGLASAQEELEVGIDVPTEATAGERVSVSTSISVPDLLGNHETDLTLTLIVDGEEVATETVTVQDGDTTTVSFSHTFQEEGTHTVAIEAGISIAGQTFSNSASKTLDITAPSTSRESDESSISATVSGAAFSSPESLQDEIDTYRDRSSLDLAPYAFVLATEDKLYLVFTDEQPSEGIATVQGVLPKQEVSTQDLTSMFS